MRIVFAPDSFKGTVSADDAAASLAAGWRNARPDDEVLLAPMADGGEGTLDVLAKATPAARWRTVPGCTGPDRRRVDGRYLLLPGGVAAVELAVTSGLPLIRQPEPLRATTRGLGEVIAAALDAGARGLVIAVGGSASTDGGAGALAALGLRLLDADDKALDDGGAALGSLARVDNGALRPPPPDGVRILTDVTHPLLGANGAAAVFGPQKGASASEVTLLDAALARFAAVMGGDPAAPGAGAAGGAAFGFAAAWGARIVPGAVAIADLIGLDDALAGADFVVTGEGRLDASSWRGKVVGEVARRTTAPLAVVCGSADGAPESTSRVVTLAELAGSVEAAMADPNRWLTMAGERLATAR
ncbi:MAG TPA: glycerate kinase [Acidothermaceae bacterium]